MGVLDGLKPARVFYYFEQLCAIPHGSGNTDAISRYCMDVAASLGLLCERDEWNNVIIRKPASNGYENAETVILQGHLDMVCEKRPNDPICMETDGLRLCTDGEYVWADGTTLGGDDGIAVAMALAVLEDRDAEHGPLEVLFTTDEETGMYGAAGLDGNRLQGRRLINIDSEAEGIFTVGCAGGARAQITIPVQHEPLDGPCVQIQMDGLLGGHSGVEIDKGRLNAAVTMGHFLQSLPCEYRIVSLESGNKDNAIPCTASCVLSVKEDITACADAFVKANAPETDRGLRLTVSSTDRSDTALTAVSSKAVAEFLCTVPNGIQAMNKAIPTLVQTSLNLGILRLGETLTATFAVRSSLTAEKRQLLERLQQTAGRFGGTFGSHGDYPAWEYREESPLRDTMTAVYRRMYKKDPIIEIIHAGLECGLLGEKLDGLDAVSIGPDMEHIHTVNERLNVASTARTYAFLCEVLKEWAK